MCVYIYVCVYIYIYIYIHIHTQIVPFCFLPKCHGDTPDNSWFACTWN